LPWSLNHKRRNPAEDTKHSAAAAQDAFAEQHTRQKADDAEREHLSQ